MHQSAANRDTKLRKVLIKYGAEGYGLYWYCLEHICADVDPKLTFELEHDSEILAHELRIDTLKVEEMMRYMVTLGLFEQSDHVITCMKLARYLGDKNTRNEDLREIIKSQKHVLSATVRDTSATVRARGEEIRGEERRLDKERVRKRTIPSDFCVDESMVDWVSDKFPDLDYQSATEQWEDYCRREGKRYADWRRAWQGGMRKADEWRAERASKHGKHQGVVASDKDSRRLSAADRVRARRAEREAQCSRETMASLGSVE